MTLEQELAQIRIEYDRAMREIRQAMGRGALVSPETPSGFVERPPSGGA